MLRLYFLQSLPVFLDTSQLVLQRLHLGAVQRTHGIKTQGKGTLAASQAQSSGKSRRRYPIHSTLIPYVPTGTGH